LAAASGVTVELEAGAVRFLPGALDYARAGAIPGGLKNNREFVSCAVSIEAPLEPGVEDLLYDPQTSGGLLISVSPGDAAALAAAIPGARRIGSVLERSSSLLRIV
jgi:selenide,water dikinase